VLRISFTFTIPFSTKASPGKRSCILGVFTGPLDKKKTDIDGDKYIELQLPDKFAVVNLMSVTNQLNRVRLVEVCFKMNYSFLDPATKADLEFAMQVLMPMLERGCDFSFQTLWVGNPNVKDTPDELASFHMRNFEAAIITFERIGGERFGRSVKGRKIDIPARASGKDYVYALEPSQGKAEFFPEPEAVLPWDERFPDGLHEKNQPERSK